MAANQVALLQVPLQTTDVTSSRLVGTSPGSLSPCLLSLPFSTEFEVE